MHEYHAALPLLTIYERANMKIEWIRSCCPKRSNICSWCLPIHPKFHSIWIHSFSRLKHICCRSRWVNWAIWRLRRATKTPKRIVTIKSRRWIICDRAQVQSICFPRRWGNRWKTLYLAFALDLPTQSGLVRSNFGYVLLKLKSQPSDCSHQFWHFDFDRQAMRIIGVPCLIWASRWFRWEMEKFNSCTASTT